MLKRLGLFGAVTLVLAGCWGLSSFPPPVTGLQATSTATSVTLSWTNPSSSFWGVRVYRASDPDKPTIYRRGDIAEAEPAVPGWRMAVDELFG